VVIPTLKNSLKIKNGKFIKINYEINNNIISKIKYTGDFFLYPEESLIDLERLLTGKKFEYDVLKPIIDTFFNDKMLIGVNASDFLQLIFQNTSQS